MSGISYDPWNDRLAFLNFSGIHDIDLLDVGAGHGLLSIIAAKEKNCTVTCIDPDPAKLARARDAVMDAEIQGMVSFQEMNALNMSYPNNHFSCVACYSLFHHVPRDEQEQVLSEVYRVAKEELIIAELNEKGAKYFDEVRHKNENHCDYVVPPSWFQQKLPVISPSCITITHRDFNYFIKVMKT